MSKNKKRLIRIVVSLCLFIAAFVLEKTITLDRWAFGLMFGAVYAIIAYDVIFKAFGNIIHGKVFDENFLMLVATAGAFAIGEFDEAVAVMLFYQVGELFQDYAVGKSRKSISELMDIRPDKAVIVNENEEITVDPEEVKIGDIILVKSGEKIPLDGTVIEGKSSLDTAALTGESVPRACTAGDYVLSGSINVGGVLKIRAEKEFYDSTVSKILDLVENVSGKKAKAENFITKFAKYYTPAVVFTALALFLIPSLITGEWSMWLSRALTFLVVSCPCALVISVPLGFFGGIGGASKKGILIKGGSYLELIGKANVFVFDKTGTLTKGKFEVKYVYPEERREEILSLAAICEEGSVHPIATSILAAHENKSTEKYSLTEVAGRGIIAEHGEERILCGNSKLLFENNVNHKEISNEFTTVYVAHNGEYIGYISIGDTVKPEAEEVIKELNASGAKTVMLTGDNAVSAKAVAEKIGIKEYRAELLPVDKVEAVEEILKKKDKSDVVAFVGDGINDAPVLMRADVGISMGGVGSDSAIEASDMVLMHDDLKSILSAKKIAKKTVNIVRQNIVFALLVKAAVLVLGALGIAGMWLAVFADVGVAVLAILNSMRTVRIK